MPNTNYEVFKTLKGRDDFIVLARKSDFKIIQFNEGIESNLSRESIKGLDSNSQT